LEHGHPLRIAFGKIKRGPDDCERGTPTAPDRTGGGHRGYVIFVALTVNRSRTMHQIIYIVGLIVVILAILSFFGLR